MPSTNTVFHLQWICCQVRWYGLHAQGARREGRPQPARGQPGVARQGVDSGHIISAMSYPCRVIDGCHENYEYKYILWPVFARLILRQRQFTTFT